MSLSTYTNANAVTPSDSTTIPRAKGLYIGVSGDVKVQMVGSPTAVIIKAAPVGILPVEVTQVFATGTTATNILALR